METSIATSRPVQEPTLFRYVSARTAKTTCSTEQAAGPAAVTARPDLPLEFRDQTICPTSFFFALNFETMFRNSFGKSSTVPQLEF